MQLQDLNSLLPAQREEELAKCCGSSTWTQRTNAAFPFSTNAALLQKADEVWWALSENDWLEAFSHHPKIGDVTSLKEKFASTAKWAAGEQASVQRASEETIRALAQGNQDYENKFGFIFIVYATGKSAEEMLQRLQSRLPNDRKEELRIAASEQAKITKLRLEKLLQ